MHVDLSGIRRQQSAQSVEQRRLATAGRSDDADDLTLPERQVEVADHGHDFPADLIALCNVLHDQRRNRSAPHDCPGIASVLTDAGTRHLRLATALSANVLSMIWSNGMLPLALPR